MGLRVRPGSTLLYTDAVEGIDEIIGHDAVRARLVASLAQGSLSHAVLLLGPPSVGKTTLAMAVAAALVDAGAWPGGIAAHPDAWIEDGDAERIGIDRVRAGGGPPGSPSLQDFLSRRAYAVGSRAVVVARAERLTEQAANCLLKTIEEPPPDAHLILSTVQADRLPATVVSRCQVMTLAPVAGDVVAAWLCERHGLDPERASSAALLSAGRPGRAWRLATEPGSLAAELQALDAFIGMGGEGVEGALRGAAQLAPATGSEGRERALVHLGVWAAFLRDVACVAAGADDLVLWGIYRPALRRWAEVLAPERVAAMLDRCLTAIQDIAGYAHPRLTYEVMFLDIFGGASPPPRTLPGERMAGPVSVAPPADSDRTSPRRRGR